MSNPRPDPPRLAAIREAHTARTEHDASTHWIGCESEPRHRDCAIRYLLIERDQLLSDLRTLEAQWREKAHPPAPVPAHIQCDPWDAGEQSAYQEVADDLAALLARLEGT